MNFTDMELRLRENKEFAKGYTGGMHDRWNWNTGSHHEALVGLIKLDPKLKQA